MKSQLGLLIGLFTSAATASPNIGRSVDQPGPAPTPFVSTVDSQLEPRASTPSRVVTSPTPSSQITGVVQVTLPANSVRVVENPTFGTCYAVMNCGTFQSISWKGFTSKAVIYLFHGSDCQSKWQQHSISSASNVSTTSDPSGNDISSFLVTSSKSTSTAIATEYLCAVK